ncbi:MAG TPA: YbhN family protein, partial [Castellaniella sp.]|nr:YbhN family protein [Castellaniella sp.]
MNAFSLTAGRHSSGRHRRNRGRGRWGKILGLVLLVVVVALLYKYAKDVDWNAVHKAVLEIPRTAIAGAAAATVLGYLAYAGMDALGRRYTGNRIAYWKVIGVSMISYAVNLNLGMLLGGVGVRMRLYMRLGCRKSLPARVAIFSGVSNWIGYGWVAGVVFLSGGVPLPPSVAAGAEALRLTGFALLVLSLIYVLACWRYPKRTWLVRGWRIVLPTLRMAIAQSVVSICSWTAMALAIYLLLQARVPFVAVLGVLLYSAVA